MAAEKLQFSRLSSKLCRWILMDGQMKVHDQLSIRKINYVLDRLYFLVRWVLRDGQYNQRLCPRPLHLGGSSIQKMIMYRNKAVM